QGIEIYIRELQRHLRGIIAAHLHCAIQIEAGILEVGAASHYQLRPSRLDHRIYGAKGFVIKLEIGDVEPSADGWSSRAGAGTGEVKTRFTFQGQSRSLEALKARQFDSSSRHIEAEAGGADVICKIASQLGSIVRKGEIGELHFPSHKLKLAAERLERLAIDGELRDLQISTTPQIARGAGGVHVDAGHAGDRIMQAGQHLNIFHRDVGQMQIERERTGGLIETAMTQSDGAGE